ncbi:hypothetical protein A8D61_37310 [Burkholderia cenocepacia]|nr:hypothetical protein A8D61_37310 [Burkholderia cenocepacia]ONO11194.1 hypothetical protein A8D69_17240 [Burkholderia cenocepacia]ONO24978.1 hypothetical protein A8D65_23305 [Burkholderia cenocepacia]ONO71098.1 hypothetical protein A8D75_21565 [Burkholderia cenocepacia]ONO91671.1 hypothetical protein A8D79_22585 [Burkholderia cenocepacia]
MRRYRFGSARSVPSAWMRERNLVRTRKFLVIARRHWRAAKCAMLASVATRVSHRYSATR